MRTVRLVFDEYPDDEVVLRVSPIPMEDYFGVLEDWAKLRSDNADAAEMVALFGRFADLALVSWSFPEPATAEGMKRRDVNLGLAMMGQWLEQVGRVPLPLPLGSSGSEPSPEDSTPPPAAG